jgi:2'-5' RNA ligase
VAEVESILAALREAAAAADAIRLVPERYRETRSVGMLVLSDIDGAATRLADDLQGRLERLGVYERERRPWLPHLTVVRFRERLRLRPPLPGLGEFSPSDAAAYHSVLRSGGAQYVVVESFALGG